MVTADQLMALTSLAGQTIVTAAVTDAWETARQKIAHLFRRGGSDRTKLAEGWLDRTHEQVTGASDADLENIRAAQASQWATRLADLLDEEPEAAVELQAKIEEIQALLPAEAVSAANRSVAAGRDVNVKGVKADRGGLAVGIATGNVTPPDPTGPGQVSS
jgi:hypothetical protein